MRALLLVDLQNDFMPGGPMGVAGGMDTVAVANRLMPYFDQVIATQDLHPLDHGSFITQHPGAQVGELVTLGGLPQTVWPVHCVQGTAGAALHGDLDQARVTKVFPKGTDPSVDSYSGFFDNGKRHATGLGDYLVQQGVRQVYVMGLATDYCVKATAMDAAELGFQTFLVVDGCRAVNLEPDDGMRALQTMEHAGIQLVTSEALGQ